jgi:DNA-binding NarL/FixJ family response regulator
MTQSIFDECVQNMRGRKEEVLKLFLQGKRYIQIGEELGKQTVEYQAK